MSADENYAVWLQCGSLAAAMLTVGLNHVEGGDVADYLADVNSVVADLEPIQLALVAAWLGHVGARALVTANAGDVRAALDEVRELALDVAVTATED